MHRILVADDDRVVSHLVSSILRGAGYHVTPAFDSMQAVMFAMRPPYPDAIVLDIHMPGGTGVQALRKLRASTRTTLIPVIVLSGSASVEHREEVRALGVVASLHKPVDPAALLDAVAIALRTRDGAT